MRGFVFTPIVSAVKVQTHVRALSKNQMNFWTLLKLAKLNSVIKKHPKCKIYVCKITFSSFLFLSCVTHTRKETVFARPRIVFRLVLNYFPPKSTFSHLGRSSAPTLSTRAVSSKIAYYPQMSHLLERNGGCIITSWEIKMIKNFNFFVWWCQENWP